MSPPGPSKFPAMTGRVRAATCGNSAHARRHCKSPDGRVRLVLVGKECISRARARTTFPLEQHATNRSPTRTDWSAAGPAGRMCIQTSASCLHTSQLTRPGVQAQTHAGHLPSHAPSQEHAARRGASHRRRMYIANAQDPVTQSTPAGPSARARPLQQQARPQKTKTRAGGARSGVQLGGEMSLFEGRGNPGFHLSRRDVTRAREARVLRRDALPRGASRGGSSDATGRAWLRFPTARRGRDRAAGRARSSRCRTE